MQEEGKATNEGKEGKEGRLGGAIQPKEEDRPQRECEKSTQTKTDSLPMSVALFVFRPTYKGTVLFCLNLQWTEVRQHSTPLFFVCLFVCCCVFKPFLFVSGFGR